MAAKEETDRKLARRFASEYPREAAQLLERPEIVEISRGPLTDDRTGGSEEPPVVGQRGFGLISDEGVVEPVDLLHRPPGRVPDTGRIRVGTDQFVPSRRAGPLDADADVVGGPSGEMIGRSPGLGETLLTQQVSTVLSDAEPVSGDQLSCGVADAIG